jgi:rhamnosyltransferase
MQESHDNRQQPKVRLIVPTLNPMPVWRAFLEALATQTFNPDRVLMVDSSSSDGARELAEAAGLEVDVVAEADFNHGGTRRAAVERFCGDCDVVVLMTQDAILAEPESLEKLLRPFEDPAVGAIYGRQLPRQDAGAIEAHGRLFNYPPESKRNRLEDGQPQCIKTAFFSNSWGAYRMEALRRAGGIPRRAICSEDTYAAGRILEAGYEIAYAADATTWHSNEMTLSEEFRRYFDIGVFHAEEPWIMQRFGGASGEGWRYVRSELRYLAGEAPWRIPEALARTVLKFTAFKLGKHHRQLPAGLVRSFSSHKAYWSQNGVDTAISHPVP